MEKLFHGQINMESVIIIGLSDKCEINMAKCVLSNASLMNLTVEPILHVALINIPGIQWSMKHTLRDDTRSNCERLLCLFLLFFRIWHFKTHLIPDCI